MSNSSAFGVPSAPGVPPHSPPPAPMSLDFDSLWGLVRRHWLLVATLAGVGLTVGLIQALTMPMTFSATSSLLIEARKVRAVQDAYIFVTDDISADSEAAAQLEVLRSDRVLQRVVERLDLTSTATIEPIRRYPIQEAFANVAATLGLSSIIPAAIADPKRDAPVPRTTEQVVDSIKSGLLFRRVPRTTLMEISYTSMYPREAVRVANALAEAYIEEQVDAQRVAAGRAADWLRDQLAELKSLVQEAEQAVQQFKATRGFVMTDGKLVEEQRMAETNRQLVAARADLEKLQYRYDQLQAMVKSQKWDAVPAEFFADQYVSQMRSRYLVLERSQRELVKRVGAGHEAAQRIGSQLADYQSLMREELTRLARTVESELAVARKREEKLRTEFDAAIKSISTTNEAQIELRELERRAEAYRALYAGIIQKHQAAQQQQSFSDAPGRIVSLAKQPNQGPGPSPNKVLVFALLGGALLGGLVAALRELTDGSFRTRRQVRTALGTDAVWVLDDIGSARAPVAVATGDGRAANLLGPTGDRFDYGQRLPRAPFARQLELVKIGIDRMLPVDSRPRIIGVASTLVGEDREVVSKNLASLIAETGARTLLIDGDSSGRALTQALSPHARAGLLDVLKSRTPLQDCLVTEVATGLHVLPAVPSGGTNHTADLFNSSAMAPLLETLAERYDYVVIDLPALTSSNEGETLAAHVAGIVMVTAWGETPNKLVLDTLENSPMARNKLIGAILSRTNPKRLATYQRSDALPFLAVPGRA